MSSPVSYTATIEGWLSEAADCASRRNLAWKVASLARSSRSVFTATTRSRRMSRARNTSAMPPRPTMPSSSYRPPRSRGCVMSRTSVTVLDRSQSCAGMIRQPGARAVPGRAGLASTWSFPAHARRSLLRLRARVCLKDLPRDGCGRVGPEPAALNYDADGDLWVVRRREAGEHRVVEPGVVRAVLRRAGLGRDGDVRHRGAAGARGAVALCGSADHHLRHPACHARAH